MRANYTNTSALSAAPTHSHSHTENKMRPKRKVPPLYILGSALRSTAYKGGGRVPRGGGLAEACNKEGVGAIKKTTERPTFGFWDWYFGFGLGVATNLLLLQLQSQSTSSLAHPVFFLACRCLSLVEAYFLASPMCVALFFGPMGSGPANRTLSLQLKRKMLAICCYSLSLFPPSLPLARSSSLSYSYSHPFSFCPAAVGFSMCCCWCWSWCCLFMYSLVGVG